MKFNTNPLTSNQILMMKQSACGVQSIICIHCKTKSDSAFKCLVSRLLVVLLHFQERMCLDAATCYFFESSWNRTLSISE